jgi:hypothetical protein
MTNSGISICIPRIEKHVTKKYLAMSFQNVGSICKIDIVYSNNGIKKAFIHFNYCYESLLGKEFSNIINNGGEVKFVHSKLGWFWKCSKSRSPKSIF